MLTDQELSDLASDAIADAFGPEWADNERAHAIILAALRRAAGGQHKRCQMCGWKFTPMSAPPSDEEK